jgi:hypothetical protein
MPKHRTHPEQASDAMSRQRRLFGKSARTARHEVDSSVALGAPQANEVNPTSKPAKGGCGLAPGG